MIKITPLMTSLHEGHKAEERIKCIDNMLFNKCEDTKNNILKAFWWYRKNSIPLDRVKQVRKEIRKLDDINPDYPMDRTIHVSRNEVLAILDDLIESEVKK